MKKGGERVGKINVLGFDIANLIAAGEVVDRPSSVVKELMENAIDAGARSLTVEIRRGGTTFIRVTDDGSGIEKDDLPVAVLRHATSKISDVADLSEIMTLGFRGEALAAIASVTKLRIVSKPPSAPLGAALNVEFGEIVDLSDAGCPDGTTVTCEALFANVPARRKFLKKDSTETAAVTAVVEKIALSSPQIAIRYITDGETKFQTPGNADLVSVIYVIYGRAIASRLRPVGRNEGGLCVDGFVSEPDLFRPNRNMMNFFINGRYVKSRTMAAAVEQAYSTHIPPDKFPFCIINFTINPQAVDVNVHPSKLEVKFTNERVVFDAVYYAVLNALEGAGSRPEIDISSRRGVTYEKTYADAKPISPDEKQSDHNHSFWVTGEDASRLLSSFASGDRTDRGKQLRIENVERSNGTPSVPVDAPTAHDNVKAVSKDDPSVVPASDIPEDFDEESEDEGLEDGLSTLSPEDRERYMYIVANAPFPITEAPPEFSLDWLAKKYGVESDVEQLMNEPQPPVPGEDGETFVVDDLPNEPDKSVTTDVEVRETNASPSAPEYAVDTPEEIAGENDRIPEYVILGEAYNCYIIAQLEDRLVLIDKHAAHERIIFDSLVEKMKRRERNSQLLMFPVDIALTDVEKDALAEFEEQITALGFTFAYTDGGAAISAIPEELSREAATDMLVDLAGSLSENLGTIESVGNEYFEARLFQASCKAAIKGGRVYARDNLRYICDRVLREPKPGESAIKTCPHGRPVAFEIKKNSIERQFQRLV